MPTTHIAAGEDMDQGTTHPGDTTTNGIFDRLDALEALFPHGFGFSDWTPRLVVDDAHNADLGHGLWQPSNPATSVNPTLGTGTYAGTTTPAGVSGRVFQVGKLVVADAQITFGAASTNPGIGAYRVSLPYPCTSRENTQSAIVGYGHLFNPAVPNTFLGLGPGNFRHVMLHNAPSVSTDVAGLVIGVNNPRPAALSATGLTAPVATITTITVAGTTATVTTSGTNNVTAGGRAVIAGNSGAAMNGTWTVLASPAPTGTTYAVTVPSGTSGGNGGTSAAVGPQNHTDDTAMNETAPGASYSQPLSIEVRNLLGTLWNADIAAWATNLFDNTSAGVPWVWGAGCRAVLTFVYEAA